jgi:glycerol uptake facilitator protein
MSASIDIITAQDHVVGQGALGWIGIGVCFGLAVMIAIYSVGHISGAHINPAVTIGLWATKKLPARDVMPYIIAQLMGGVIAGFVQLALVFNHAGLDVVGLTALGTTDLGSNVLVWQGLLAEIVFTAILMLVICGATDKRAPSGFAGLVVGGAVGGLVAFGSQISGCSMNPARTFGPAVASMHFANHWIYWVGPIVGVLIGAFTYRYISKEK